MAISGKAELFTVKEAAEYLGLSRSSVDVLIRLNQLRAVNMATNPNAARAVWRVTRDDLENFIRSRKTRPLPPKIQAA